MMSLQIELIWNSINTLWMLILLWWSILLIYMDLRSKCYGQMALAGGIAFASYWMLQFLFRIVEHGDQSMSLEGLLALWMRLPCAAVSAVCAVLALCLVALTVRYRQWTSSHLSYHAFKEAVDQLPAGICCYFEDGRIILKNRTMTQLCRRITGQKLLNGIRFHQAVFDEPLLNGRRQTIEGDVLVVLADGSVFSFSEAAAVDENQPLHMLIAADVTQEYCRTQALRERKQQVEQLNERLVNYRREVAAMIASKEVLNAKIRIHNELGASLLATKKYLQNGTEADKDALLCMIRQNLAFLKQDAQVHEKDEYQLILNTAHELGLAVEVTGELPQTEPLKHIAATAVHECCTNTIRHAQGSKVWVRSDKDEHAFTMVFFNDGKQPTEPIVEKGGLSSLRRLVEQIHGELTITTTPDFRLTLILPREENADDLSCAGCGRSDPAAPISVGNRGAR